MPEELDQARVVTAIQSATSEVFSTMLAMETTAKEAYRHAGKPEPTNGVVALIGLTGKWMGTGSISCSAELAREISGHLLMAEYASVDQEVLDAIGEVTNMIIGSFKNALEDYLGPMGLSIPVVIFGHNFMASSIHTVDWVVVPFACGSGQLEVRVCLAPQPQQQYNRRATDHQMPTSQVTL